MLTLPGKAGVVVACVVAVAGFVVVPVLWAVVLERAAPQDPFWWLAVVLVWQGFWLWWKLVRVIWPYLRPRGRA